MVKMHIWKVEEMILGVVVSPLKINHFYYLQDYSHCGITIVETPIADVLWRALLMGEVTEPTSEFHKFACTFPSQGMWKLMSDGTWINHK